MSRASWVDLQSTGCENTDRYKEGMRVLDAYAKVIGISTDEILKYTSGYELKVLAQRTSPEVSLYVKSSPSDLSGVMLATIDINILENMSSESAITPQEAVNRYYLGKPKLDVVEKELLEFQVSNPSARFLRKRSKYFSNPVDILKRLKTGKVTLFQPWGFSYSEDTSINPESLEALEEDLMIQMGLSSLGIDSKLIVTPADVYAGKINGYRSRLITEYYSNLRTALESASENVASRLEGLVSNVQPNFEFRPYSALIKDFPELYNEAIKNAKAKAIQFFADYYISPEYQDARLAAKQFSLRDPERSAQEYIIERLAEAELVEKVFNPIKISLASQGKDTFDENLPRIYPKYVKSFPWLKRDEK